ncbi:hypothetical protein XELAEV_18002060mg [Xenopus laevis]|nr:hypothetical protein XELAEV_18002060mg [Xenopus laevis]
MSMSREIDDGRGAQTCILKPGLRSPHACGNVLAPRSEFTSTRKHRLVGVRLHARTQRRLSYINQSRRVGMDCSLRNRGQDLEAFPSIAEWSQLPCVLIGKGWRLRHDPGAWEVLSGVSVLATSRAEGMLYRRISKV